MPDDGLVVDLLSVESTNEQALHVAGGVEAEHLKSTDDAEIADDLNVGGNLNVTGTAGITGIATFASNVIINGVLSLAGWLAARYGGHDPGDLKWTAASATPSFWAFCNGRELSRETPGTDAAPAAPELFAKIGTAYGAGNGTTTFNIPDTRSRMLVGVGDGGIGFTNRTRGATGGSETHTLTNQELSNHSHGDGSLATDTHSESNHSHGDGSLATDTHSESNHSHGNGSLATDTHSESNHSHGNGSLATDTHSESNHSHGGSGLSAASAGSHSHSYTDSRNAAPSVRLTLGATAVARPEGEQSTGKTTGTSGSHSHSISGSTGSAGGFSHSHDVSGSTGSAGGFSHSHDVSGSTGSAGGFSHSHDVSGNTGSAGGFSHSHDVSGSTGTTGGGNAHNNMPPFVGARCLIFVGRAI